MQTTKKRYSVAQHEFTLVMPKEDVVWGLLTSLLPFNIKPSDTEPLFEMQKVKRITISDDAKLAFQDNIDNPGFPRVDIYTSSKGTYFVMRRHYNNEIYGRIFISDNHKLGEFELVKPDSCPELPPAVQLTVANFALTMHYCLASAPFQTLLFHSSAVTIDGKAYLFLGKSGTGKSTHSSMWLDNFGDKVELLNDDHPVVRVHRDGSVVAYGSPWSGKTPCYKSKSAKVGAIVRIKRAGYNRATRLSSIGSYASLSTSCSSIRWSKEQTNYKNTTLNNIVCTTPCYQMECLPDLDAAEVCYNSMKIDSKNRLNH